MMEGNEVTRPHYGRAKQSWPLFCIFGFFGSCFFIFTGTYLITKYGETKNDPGMLYVGIFFLLMGIGLLAGVIGAFFTQIIGKGKDDTDFSIAFDIAQALGKTEYSAEKLVRKVHNGRNNVVTINTVDGFLRFYGYNGSFITEVRRVFGEDFRVYYLTVPNQMDDSATVLPTLLERFPTRVNRIISDAMVVSAVQKLYETQSLEQMLYYFSYVDATEETKKLIMKDAYITPEVPVVIVSPTSDEGKKRAMREQTAMQELQV